MSLDFGARVALPSRGMPRRHTVAVAAVAAVAWVALAACSDAPYVPRPPAPPHDDVYMFASGCYTVDATSPGSDNTRWLAASSDGARFAFDALAPGAGARFTLRASDLGTYLFYDSDRRYLVAEDGKLARVATLASDLDMMDESFVSPAEWELEVSASDPERFQLRHRQTGRYLTKSGLTDDAARAAVVSFYPATGCAEFPELTVDAEGDPTMTHWPDGDLYGVVDTHTHLFTDFGFGGGGIFHGAPFHRLGVEKALPSCEPFHGPEGRRDVVGYLFNGLGNWETNTVIDILATGETPAFDHHPDGYPTFTDWPNAWKRATHQTQYYRWLERAWRGGLRLIVQHATGNSVLCELVTGSGVQAVRYSCNDMVGVDHEIDAAYALERYIDAQWGGPGKGWFRIVTSPAEARQVIGDGKLAVILGIETSNLFDCFLTPPAGTPACDAAHVKDELDRYYARGVRAIFPVHKFDNAFSAGDGDRRVGQIGSFVNSGHWSNFVPDCPDTPAVFDHGPVQFGGINMPRADYLAPAPNDMSDFHKNPLLTLAPFLSELEAPPLDGEYCQNAGLTPLGETLLVEMMKRGMIIELDHLPRRSYARAFELLVANDYPAVGSHGQNNGGLLYDRGGVSKAGLGRCNVAGQPGAMVAFLRSRIAVIAAHGGYPAEGFGFDLNGFAGAARPRFGPDSGCTDAQSNPVSYPFTSYAGDVTFTAPHLGERTVDFNTEGFLHVGLLPELIQDARLDGASDADLEPLFRSAEGYLRMWERAEARGAAL
jgi:microsomal dipeptidase-like Zn-dependent dipeptidase